jgi:CBS domain-containing protein
LACDTPPFVIARHRTIATGIRKQESRMKKIREIMTPQIHMARPDQTIQQAAGLMSREDVGCLPVGDDDKLIGMVTDRDLVVRALAKGRGPETHVRDVMTSRIKYCFDDQDVDEVARNMAELHVRRLPVVNREKRLVGFVALSNIVQAHDGRKSGETLLRGVAMPH